MLSDMLLPSKDKLYKGVKCKEMLILSGGIVLQNVISGFVLFIHSPYAKFAS